MQQMWGGDGTIAGHTGAEDERVGEPFAHFVDGRDLQQAILDASDAAGLDVEHDFAVSGIDVDTYGVSLSGDESPSRLLVGADGAKSAVRKAAGEC